MTDNGNLLIEAQTELGEGLPQLQRGGEALALETCQDRFTFCPAPQQSVAAVLAALKSPDQDRLTTTAILPSLTEICAPAEQVEDLMQAARRSGTAFVSPVYQMRQSPGTLIYPTDQITVQFAESSDSGRMQQLTAQAGLRILKLIAGVPKAFVFQVTARNPLKLADWLIQQPDVLLAEPNVAILRQPYYRPRESGYAQQWYLNHEGGEALANGSHIFAEAAWNLTRGKRSIAIAVVDERIDLRHPDLQSEGKIVAPLDLSLALQTGDLSKANPKANQESSQEPTQPEPTQKASESHGTALARLIAADETGKGMIGIAPGCALMPIRIGQFVDDQVIEQVCQSAIEQKADVLCCGWGAAAVYFPLSLRQRVALSQAATQGRDGRGCVIVFAAGNANRPIDGTVLEQGWPNQLLQGETRWLNGFAVHPDVITVAACTSLNQKSACSNWGANVAVAAPGGQSAPMLYTQLTGEISTGPSVGPQAGRKLMADPSEPLGDTSGACGIVAGVVALMLSINPDLTAREVQQILQQTADRIVDQVPDAQLGLSLGSYDATRYSAWFGSGKVNAIRAVELAQRALLPLPLPYRWVQYRQLEPLDIPDANPQGLVSKVQVLEADLIRDIEVSVEIEHEFLGDLTLSLVAPWGKAIPLQSRALGRLTMLKTTYSLETVFWLKALLNHSAQGEWQLRVIDQVPTRTGRLQTWQLNLGL